MVSKYLISLIQADYTNNITGLQIQFMLFQFVPIQFLFKQQRKDNNMKDVITYKVKEVTVLKIGMYQGTLVLNGEVLQVVTRFSKQICTTDTIKAGYKWKQLLNLKKKA